MNPELPLRDIHLPPEPSWWPPAPGWWLLALLLVAALVWLGRRILGGLRARRRRRALLAEYEALAAISDARAQLAAMSALLRRAARLRAPEAATLDGSAWAAFLQRTAEPLGGITPADRDLLAHGLYRRDLDAAAVRGLLGPVRRCYLALVPPR